MATYNATLTDVQYKPGGHAWQAFNVFTPSSWAASDRFRTTFVWTNLAAFQITGRHTQVTDLTGSGVTDGSGSPNLLSNSGPFLEALLREGHQVISASCTFTDQTGIKGRGIFYPPEYSDVFEDRFATLDSPQKDACWIMWKVQQMMADGVIGQSDRIVMCGNSAGSTGALWVGLGCDRRGQMGVPNDFTTRPMMVVATAGQGVWWPIYDATLTVAPGHLPKSADIDAPAATLSDADATVQRYASALRYAFDTSVPRWKHVVELNKHVPIYLYSDKVSVNRAYGDGSVGVYTGAYTTGTEVEPHTAWSSIALFHALKELNTLASPSTSDSFHSNLSFLAANSVDTAAFGSWTADVATEADGANIDTQAALDASIVAWGAVRAASPASMADRAFQRPFAARAVLSAASARSGGTVLQPRGAGGS